MKNLASCRGLLKLRLSLLTILTVLLWLLSLSIPTTGSSPNPQKPHNLTWLVFNTATGKVVGSASKEVLHGTWYPELIFDLCDLVGSSWDDTGKNQAYGCRGPGPRTGIQNHYFYVCPGSTNSSECGGFGDYFCGDWNCVSTGYIYWPAPLGSDLIQVTKKWEGVTWDKCKQGNCTPVSIKFTVRGKAEETQWYRGLTWGLRLYATGKDPGVLFTIQLQAEPQYHPTPIGPDPVLVPPTPVPVLTTLASASLSSVPAHPRDSTEVSKQRPSTGPLGILQASYQFLNAVRPDLTNSCWLCLNMDPPYYEGIAMLGQVSPVAFHSQCRRTYLVGLTLQAISGTGTCVGSIPARYRHLCSSILEPRPNQTYLVPPNNAWWACSFGLTHCLHTRILKQNGGFCVMVQLLPHIFYHTNEQFLSLLEAPIGAYRHKREAVTTSSLWGVGGAGDFGIPARTQLQDRFYREMQRAIDLDLQDLSGGTHHQDSPSLAEVAVRNKRIIDLLSLKQAGLCTCLGEECCVDEATVTFLEIDNNLRQVRKHLARVEESLDERKRERELKQSEILPSWLIALLCTLIIPLVLLLLFSCCRSILNALVKNMEKVPAI